MIELLTGFPDNVVAAVGKGQITRNDYEQVLIPRARQALALHDKVRIYYELDADFAGIELGAVWDDAKLGLAHRSRWERVAVVTDVPWIHHSLSVFSFLFPGEMRGFALTEAAKARDWLLAP